MTIGSDDQVTSDEEIARALQERFREEEEAAAAERATRDATAPSDAGATRRRLDEELRAAEAFETSMYSGGDIDDAIMAQRMEQEAQDAALAAILAHQDVEGLEASASREVAQNIIAQDEALQRRLRRKRSINSFLACIGGVAFTFLLFRFLPMGSRGADGGGDGGNPFDLTDWFQGGEWETGYKNGDNAWASSKQSFSGLNLRVLNNLDEKWQDTFFIVMNEWDNGDPDAVSFRIERVTEPCQMVPDAMVVCNDDYGPTSWRGINELLTNNGYVVSSVAKLNDFYLEGTDNDLRQYVCCHEIGHGLGLGHTDEAMYNPDLGECMDYTVRPEVNMHPGRTNFEALAKMYGSVNGGRDREHQPGDRRANAVEYSTSDLEWRLLRRTEGAEHYEGDLGDGRKVRRILLLA
mmetsp:Transcript_27147/g.51319  ORF Transcript_27147/g.51319 Transcript_27147/m.51319 type:complete len:408 (+) Transcript_27147:109-1332(+)